MIFVIMVAFSGTKHGSQQDAEVMLESSSKTGVKRKQDGARGQKSKVVKASGDVSTSKAVASVNAENPVCEDYEVAELQIKMEAQSKEMWTLKDDLKKHVTTAELREMLDANDQDSAGSELDLRERWYVIYLFKFFMVLVLKR